ncbi:MAG: GNAT family N-acetyltransferase [Deltaproteobacteria bacterium]|nr:GNAT family N-acetyltransferase [Deltaproteobacteria bacterium]MBW2416438.1 GNAT family N-acetyltransferase [Deltaproteobacteria bacterium]
MSGIEIELTDPSTALVEELDERLYEFNRAATGIDDGEGLGAVVRGPDGEVLAAAAGHSWGGTCEIRQVWVHESLRGRGVGRGLMRAVEAEARRRGCRQLVLGTHSFQAPGFYAKLGFEEVGRLDDYPRGHANISLRKALRPD